MCQKGFFTSSSFWGKAIIICGLIILIPIFLLILAIWIVIPLIFMNTVSLQRFCIFLNVQNPRYPEFNNSQKYGLEGIVNFYVTTEDLDKSLIGAWLVIPESEIKSTPIDNQIVADLLKNTTYPILIYLHGIGCNRIIAKDTYKKLRKHFMIVSIDPRGYGDSGSDLHPSELGIANDTAEIFKWVKSKTNNDIYMWGHSLGGALSTHAVRKLKEVDNIVPNGLVLESTFTTMREAIGISKLLCFITWLPWFEATIQRPLEKNGFLFRTTTNIIYVDCPIMILHSEDDEIIPYTIGKMLAEVASTKRVMPPQGHVTYHQFGSFGYKHTGLTADPNMSKYIDNFITYCKKYNKRIQ